MLLLRNPWGRTSYSGAWKKTDANWNTDTKTQAATAYPGFDPVAFYDLGFFVMPISEVMSAKCLDDI